MKGIHINQEIETVQFKGIEVSLLAASKDGTEIIRHRLDKGYRWGLHAQEGFDALEFLQITRGKMILLNEDNNVSLSTGDFLYANPVLENALLVAEEETEFLYTSSQPIFHYYSQVVKRYTQLAIDVEEKDGYTADHCKRITDLSMKIGAALNLSYNDLLILNYAAFFHDIGKIRVPDRILNKSSKLTEDEWEIIKKHCTFGREILEEANAPVMKQVALIVEQHHERYDGKGYPFGLKGDEIDLKASIISVVDSFDAMTIDRVYQKARTVNEALEELTRCKGTMYNPMVVDTFLSIIENEER